MPNVCTGPPRASTQASLDVLHDGLWEVCGLDRPGKVEVGARVEEWILSTLFFPPSEEGPKFLALLTKNDLLCQKEKVVCCWQLSKMNTKERATLNI